MINGATVTLAGYVATEPHYKTVNDEIPHVSLRVAWTSRFRDRETGEWRDGKTSFANVNCWRKLANNVVSSLRKGQAIVVMGRLQVREFDDREGRRRTAVDIEADAIGHDLYRGVAHFQRTFRPAGETVEGQSHAWVEWWCGGWEGYDPTNGVPTGTRHAAVARGRDYADVPPLKGLYNGAPSSYLGVTVEVTRLG